MKKVDHTLLKQPSTWEQIREICDDAVKYGTASVCIPPSYVKQAAEYLDGKMPVCTVIGFPNGYDTMIEQGGTNVSGGQKQRLCIARALLKKPKILILDDSTSAVDTRTDAMIRQAFREEIPGTTKLIIAQRIASVQDADIIVVLDNGMVKDVGTHESLLASSKIYQEVYYSQQKGGEE